MTISTVQNNVKITADNIKLEVCVDNIESVETVHEIGVDRIELCSSLGLGGLSPTISLLKYVHDNSKIPIHAMVRPRPGDFCYSKQEIEYCLKEIKFLSQFKISGIVFGALNKSNEINIDACKCVCESARKLNLEITFHRAVDLTKDYEPSIQALKKIGFTRILTSGHTDNVEKGIQNLKHIQCEYGKHIQIMAGGGVKLSNISLLKASGIQHIHCSASTMKIDSNSFILGKNSGDLSYQITSSEILKKIKELIYS